MVQLCQLLGILNLYVDIIILYLMNHINKAHTKEHLAFFKALKNQPIKSNHRFIYQCGQPLIFFR